MNIDRDKIEANLRLHVDRLAGLIGVRTLKKPKTIQATIGYIEGQWAGMGYTNDRECYDALGDDRHQLSSQSKLPPSNRHPKHTRLPTHDRGDTRRCLGHAAVAWLAGIIRVQTDIPQTWSH